MLAEARVEPVLGEGAEVLERFPGREIEGTALRAAVPVHLRGRSTASAATRCWPADFVSADDGTGLVHTAIAFGEDDFRLGEQYGLNVVNPVRADGTYDERIGPYAGPLREGRRPRPDRRPRVARPDLPRRAVRARLPALLALRHAAALLREARAGTSARPRAATSCSPRTRRSTGTRSTSSTGASASGSRTTSTGRCRASATGARRCRCGAARRATSTASARSPSCASWPATTSRRTCTAPTSTTSCSPVPDCGKRDAPRARGDRRLVRLGRDAVRAVPLPVRERGAVRAALPRRLHLRGARPDARLVLLAAGGVDAAVRHERATATCCASG